MNGVSRSEHRNNSQKWEYSYRWWGARQAEDLQPRLRPNVAGYHEWRGLPRLDHAHHVAKNREEKIKEPEVSEKEMLGRGKDTQKNISWNAGLSASEQSQTWTPISYVRIKNKRLTQRWEGKERKRKKRNAHTEGLWYTKNGIVRLADVLFEEDRRAQRAQVPLMWTTCWVCSWRCLEQLGGWRWHSTKEWIISSSLCWEFGEQDERKKMTVHIAVRQPCGAEWWNLVCGLVKTKLLDSAFFFCSWSPKLVLELKNKAVLVEASPKCLMSFGCLVILS